MPPALAWVSLQEQEGAALHCVLGRACYLISPSSNTAKLAPREMQKQTGGLPGWSSRCLAGPGRQLCLPFRAHWETVPPLHLACPHGASSAEAAPHPPGGQVTRLSELHFLVLTPRTAPIQSLGY